jgi:hypothetical protein
MRIDLELRVVDSESLLFVLATNCKNFVVMVNILSLLVTYMRFDEILAASKLYNQSFYQLHSISSSRRYSVA